MRLQVGSVLRLFVRERTANKEKFVVVVGHSDETLCFATAYINSEVNRNVHRTPAALRAQVPVAAEGHPFLSHLSYIDCASLAEREVGHIEAALEAAPSTLVGALDDITLRRVIQAIGAHPDMPRRIKRLYGFHG